MSKFEIRTRNPRPCWSSTSKITSTPWPAQFYPSLTPQSTSADALPCPYSSRATATQTPPPLPCSMSGGTAISSSTAPLPDLHRTHSDPLILKDTYSAFKGTGLEEMLKEIGVKEVIVTGVMTNLCCETTAREAFIRGFRVFFSTDATATSSSELHEATLKNLAYGFAYLFDYPKLQNALSN